MSGDVPASEVVLEARAAREAGRLWQARDLLTAHVEEERDAPALHELGDVLTEMGDLPRAGATAPIRPGNIPAPGIIRREPGMGSPRLHPLPAARHAE